MPIRYMVYAMVVHSTWIHTGSGPHEYMLRHIQDERHSYEKCQYDEFKKRVAKMEELRKEGGAGFRSN